MGFPEGGQGTGRPGGPGTAEKVPDGAKVERVPVRYPLLFRGLVAFLGAVLVVSAASPITYYISAFEVQLSLAIFNEGNTEVVLPPVGEIRARTHLTPLKFTIALRNVDIDLLKSLVERSETRREFVDRLKSRLYITLWRFVVRILLFSALGGALGLLILGIQEPRALANGALVGSLSMAVLLVSTYLTYDVSAFRRPQYSGLLKAAPWTIGLLQESILKLEKLEAQMVAMARNLVVLYSSIDRLKPLDPLARTLKVLSVSDMHNNPAGFEFVEEIVRTFGIDLVIDTGDITDYGTPLEATSLKRLETLGIPYVFAAGNHDSPETLSILSGVANVVLLQGEVVEVKGLRIAGGADPSSTRLSPAVATPREVAALRRQLEEVVELEPKPDVLAVHLPQVAFSLAGRVPVILYGHTHSPSVREEQGTVMINPGTTGAAGIRGLQASREVPYSVVLLHFEPEEGTLLAADLIKVFNIRAGFSLERTLFQERAGREAG